MLGRIKTDNIGTWEFEKVRYYLIFSSAGFKLLLEVLNKKYKISRNDPRALSDRLFSVELGIEPQFNADIKLLLENLGIHRYLLDKIIIGNGITDLRYLEYYKNPIYYGPIEETGYFIRVTDYTRKETVLSAFKELKERFRDMKKDPSVSGMGFIRESKTKQPNLKYYFKVFTLVESMLKDKLSTYFSSNTEEKDIESRMTDIFKEVVVELEHKKPDEVQKQDIDRIKDIYYTKILKYYSLPTPAGYLSCLKKLKNEQQN